MSFFLNKNKRVRGWRILAVFMVMVAFFAVQLIAHVGWSKDTRSSVIVIACMFLGVGVMMWAIDALQQRRQQRVDQGLPSRIPAWLFTPRGRVPKELLASLFGLVFIPVVLMAIAPRLYHEWASLRWSSATGQSLGVEVLKDWDHYQVTAQMQYDFGGSTYSERIPANSSKVISLCDAQRLEQVFAAGTTHKVYVDPAKPSRATLHRGPGVGGMIATVTVPLLGIMFMCLSLRTLRKSLAMWDEGADPMRLNARFDLPVDPRFKNPRLMAESPHSGIG